MGFPRGGVAPATGGVGRGGAARAAVAAVLRRRPAPDFVPVPKERRGQTIRRIVAFFRPYRLRSWSCWSRSC